MTRQVAFSSLDITFYNKQGERTTNENGFSYRFKQAITQSWDIVQGLFFTIITLWPVLVIALIGFWWFRRWARKRKLQKDAE
jgi:nitrate reductase NapE component